MNKKYELTSESIAAFGRKLFRIKALISFRNVEVGEIGGFIEKEENLSQNSNAWVYGNAKVYGNTWVSGNAEVCDDVVVSGNAWVYGNVVVSGNAKVYGNAEVYGNVKVTGNAKVYGNAWVSGNAKVYDNAEVCDDVVVYGNAEVYDNAEVCDDVVVTGNAKVYGNAWVSGNAKVYGNADIQKLTHLFQIGAIGERNGFATFFRLKTNTISVACGCFFGDIKDFEKKVEETHKGTKHEKTYKLAIQLAKEQIELN